MRNRSAVLLIALTTVGCGSRTDPARFFPSPDAARAALTAALEAWKESRPTGRLAGASPAVHVVDETRSTPRLGRYEILGIIPGDGPPTFNVLLVTETPPERRSARYVVVGIDPLWVFRQEDFDKMAHWEMDMKHDESDGRDAAKPSERAP
jgi:hypothetical protein